MNIMKTISQCDLMIARNLFDGIKLKFNRLKISHW